MLEDIIQLHRQGRLAEAEQAYRNYIEDHPDDHGAPFMLGGLLMQSERLPEAVVQFNRAVSLAPDRADYFMMLAGVQMRLGRHEAARHSFNAAIRIDPNAAPAYTGLARLAAAAGDRAEAEANIRLALRADPDWADAQLLGGSLASERGDHDEAVRLLSRLAARQPRSAQVQAVLGNALLAQGSAAFAEQAYRNALALDPDMASARTCLARALMQQNRAEEARNLLREASGGDPEAALALGEASLAEGDFAAAVGALAPLHARAPGATFATEGLAAALIELGRFDEAVAVLQAWHDADPKARGVYAAMAELDQRRGHPAGVIEALERWLQIEPDDVEALERLALAVEGRDGERALRHAEAALALDPERPGALLVKGRALLRNGQAAAARAHLEPLLDRFKDRVQVQALHRALGAVNHALGRCEHAAAHWTMVHRLAPKPDAMPVLAAPEALQQVRPQDTSAGQGDLRPVFLVTSPGVELAQVAALLGDLGVPALLDRFAVGSPRSDGFGDFDHPQWPQDDAGARAQAFAEAYRQGLAHTDVDPARPFVDVLPALDARWLPVFEAALPGSRLLILKRDGRDAFINWLACGSAPQPPLVDDRLGAVWLYQVMVHLRHAAMFPSACVLDLDRLLMDDRIPDEVVALFDATGEERRPQRFRAALAPTAGLPVWLEAGAWEPYAGALPGAFSILEDDSDATE